MLRAIILSLLFVIPASAQSWTYGSRDRGRFVPDNSPGTADLIAAWEFESGALLTDSHGSNTLTNGSGIGGSDCSSQATTPDGVVGNYADCLSNNFFMGIPNASATSLLFGDEDFSIAFWFYEDAINTTSAWVMGIWANGNSYQLQHDDDYAGDARWQVSDGSTVGNHDLGASNDINITTWHFIVLTHDSVNNEICASVDNATAACTGHTVGANSGSSSDFCIGSHDSGAGNCTGSGESTSAFDQMFVFGDILTADEITWLYNSGSGRAYADL